MNFHKFNKIINNLDEVDGVLILDKDKIRSYLDFEDVIDFYEVYLHESFDCISINQHLIELHRKKD